MSKKSGNKGGRPSKYSKELIADICERLSNGEPLAAICRDEGMPDPSTVWDWQQNKPEVSQAIARAREIGEEVIAAECLDIADDLQDHPASRRVRVETRLKLLAKWNPKKWGEKVAIGGADGLPPMRTALDASKLSDAALKELLSARAATDGG